jgi:hypothetical protein
MIFTCYLMYFSIEDKTWLDQTYIFKQCDMMKILKILDVLCILFIFIKTVNC